MRSTVLPKHRHMSASYAINSAEYHPRPIEAGILIASLVAVGCFSISGIIVLKALRKPRI